MDPLETATGNTYVSATSWTEDKEAMRTEMAASLEQIEGLLEGNKKDVSAVGMLEVEGLRLANFAQNMYNTELIDKWAQAANKLLNGDADGETKNRIQRYKDKLGQLRV